MQIQQRWARFQEVVGRYGEERFILFVTQVDPDALGAAMGLMGLMQQMGVEDIHGYYCGAIGHPQNRAVFNRYNLAQWLKPASEYLPSEAHAEHLILVDSSTLDDNRLCLEHPLPVPRIVIDHHRGSPLQEGDDDLIWIEEVGAASTLVAELMGASGFAFAEHLSLLLALGIYTDTKSLLSADARDREAYNGLLRQFPQESLRSFIDYSLPESHFAHLSHALGHLHRQGPYLLANAGRVAPEDGDDLSSIADVLIRMEGVSLVIVWGILGKKVRISARNTELSTPLDVFLKQRFGSRSGAKLTPDGKGEGGAQIELELGFWESAESEEEILSMVSKKLQSLIFP